MSYVSNIRRLVGHIPLQLPGTGIVLWRTSDPYDVEFLLQERTDSGKYGLLGGGIELDETYLECAVREVREEAGIDISADELNLFQVYAGPNHVTVKPNGDIVHHTVVVYTMCYEGDFDSTKFQAEETGNLEWITLVRLRNMLMEDSERYFFHNNIPILWDVVREFYE